MNPSINNYHAGSMRAVPGLSYNLETTDEAGVVLQPEAPASDVFAEIRTRYAAATGFRPESILHVRYDVFRDKYICRVDTQQSGPGRFLGAQLEVVVANKLVAVITVADSFRYGDLKGIEYMKKGGAGA